MTTARVEPGGLWLPESWNVVIDVLFEDQRVFAIAPQRYEPQDGLRAVSWPRALLPYLKGSTTVVLRAHLDGQVLHREDVAFDDSPAKVQVVDDEGYVLALNKWGDLQRPFEAGSPESRLLLDDLGELLTTLNDDLGRPAFIAYGTLLGAVRAGKFIGHDTDADIAYYSRHEHPADILRESFLVQRHLARSGWIIRRRGGGFLQVWRDGAADERKIDIFTAYHLNDWFAVSRWVRARLPRDAVLPLGEAVLEGITFPAPRDPEALLAATYGPDWRIPDPSFKFFIPDSMGLRGDGWLGRSRLDKRRWRRVVLTGKLDRRDPSAFARHVGGELAPRSRVLEVGSGSGADALWLAGQGHSVEAIDYVPDTVRRNNEQAAQLGVDARFEALSLYDLRPLMVRAARLAKEPGLSIYARNVLEALHPPGRDNLWSLAVTALGGGGSLFLEFRTDTASDGSAQRPRKPWLRTLAPEKVSAEIQARGGRVTQERLITDERGQFCWMVARWGPPEGGSMSHDEHRPDTEASALEHEHLDYWEGFYASKASTLVPQEPSAFARWVADREQQPCPMVDVGTGTGRDALWFARNGFDVVGLDYAQSAVALATAHAQNEGISARFERLNLYHVDELTETGGRLASELGPQVLYARFFVHALEDDGRENLWRLARLLLKSGGRAYLEFRVTETNHVFGEHFRHFVAPEVVMAEIEAVGGRIEHHEVDRGLAVYKDEDPLVCRIVAAW